MQHRVLIVDDDPVLRKGMAVLVETLGYEVVQAGSVKDGLDNLSTGPSHLILDLNLPDGLGTAILRHVRTSSLPVKVAVLSGTSDASLIAEVDGLRPDATFTKPPDWDALLGWVADP